MEGLSSGKQVMNKTFYFGGLALVGMSGFIFSCYAQAPSPQVSSAQSSVATTLSGPAYPKELLQMQPTQQLLWHKWTDSQTLVLLWRQRQEYVTPKGQKPLPTDTEADEMRHKNPGIVIQDTRPDWWLNYNVELRRVGKPPKIVWHQQRYISVSLGREDNSPYEIHDVAVDAKSLVFTFTLYASGGFAIEKAQFCSLNGPPSEDDDIRYVRKREPTRLKIIRTDYGRTVYIFSNWPIITDPKTRITKEVPPVAGQWLLNVSDTNGAKSKWRFAKGAWKVVQPYTPAPKPTKAQREARRKRDAARRKSDERASWMSVYKRWREVFGSTKAEATAQVRSESGIKDWTPLPQAWDTPDLQSKRYWLTPTPEAPPETTPATPAEAPSEAPIPVAP